MNAPRDSEPRRRRRRTPEVAEQEIIDAAEALLRERPFRELTVDEVMRRHGAVAAVVLRLLPRPPPPRAARRRAHRRRAVHDGRPLVQGRGRRAGAGARGDRGHRRRVRRARPGAARARRRRGRRPRRRRRPTPSSCRASSTSTAEHIEREVAAGRILPLDARETATALVWMNERYLTLSLGREPATERAIVARDARTRSGRASSTAPPSPSAACRQAPSRTEPPAIAATTATASAGSSSRARSVATRSPASAASRRAARRARRGARAAPAGCRARARRRAPPRPIASAWPRRLVGGGADPAAGDERRRGGEAGAERERGRAPGGGRACGASCGAGYRRRRQVPSARSRHERVFVVRRRVSEPHDGPDQHPEEPGRLGHRRRADDRRAAVLPRHARRRGRTRRSPTTCQGRGSKRIDELQERDRPRRRRGS